MALQKVRSEIEAIETSYMALGMQLKLVMGYLKDEVPETELARQFLLEAKKMTSEIIRILNGLEGSFRAIDRKLGTDVTKKAEELHGFISPYSTEPAKGVAKSLDAIEERILANDTPQAVERLESLQASLGRGEAIAIIGQYIDWGALRDDDLAKAEEAAQEGKGEGDGGVRKITLIHSASPEDRYLIEGLIGKFLKKNNLEPIYVTGEGDGAFEGGNSNLIIAFITKDMARPEKRIPQATAGEGRTRTVVYVETGVDAPREIKNRYDLKFFSRDRTGELLLQIMEDLEGA
jgi:hypothetical protein